MWLFLSIAQGFRQQLVRDVRRLLWEGIGLPGDLAGDPSNTTGPGKVQRGDGVQEPLVTLTCR
jgi:hypothetical protein